MINTGIVRNIDGAGRLVIPKEILKARGIKNGDPMAFLTDGDDIILRKYDTACNAADKLNDLISYLELNKINIDDSLITKLRKAIIGAGGADA